MSEERSKIEVRYIAHAKPLLVYRHMSAFLNDCIKMGKWLKGMPVLCDFRYPDPQWAVVNHGFFVCSRCVTFHREMGPDMSKVKSLQLDLSWTREWLDVSKRALHNVLFTASSSTSLSSLGGLPPLPPPPVHIFILLLHLPLSSSSFCV